MGRSLRVDAIHAHARGRLRRPRDALGQAKQVAGSIPLDDPRVSPLFADLTGLPRTLVQIGTAERLLDEARELVRRASTSGVDATLDELADMPHAAQLLAEWSPQGHAAIERAAKFLTQRA